MVRTVEYAGLVGALVAPNAIARDILIVHVGQSSGTLGGMIALYLTMTIDYDGDDDERHDGKEGRGDDGAALTTTEHLKLGNLVRF